MSGDGWDSLIFESTNHRPVEKKLVIMINNILSSKFHFQKWWSGFCFRKTRSVTFPKFQRKKLWPGTQYFCLDFVSVNHSRWRSQIRIFKIFLDFVSMKHGGWFPNYWILFPWFANKGKRKQRSVESKLKKRSGNKSSPRFNKSLQEIDMFQIDFSVFDN